MEASRRQRRTALAACGILLLFVVLRWPLLHGDGPIQGTNVDTSIIALMGKKMFEGRGFDIFCWGVGHLGPLTSMFTAAWAFPLEALHVVWLWPLAVRLASMTEVALGIGLVAWAVARFDRRAAFVVALLLATGPPDLFSMSVFPFGHEMAFFLGAAMLAATVQHWTAPEGSGCLSTAHGRVLLGALAGAGWWMNRTMALVTAAVLLVAAVRSDLFAHVRDFVFPRADAARRGLTGALVFVLQWSGIALLTLYIIRDLFGFEKLPFLVGPMWDGAILLAASRVIALVPRLALVRLTSAERIELRNLAQAAIGFVLGMAPSWIARVLHWYPTAYTAGIGLQQSPGNFVNQLRTEGGTVLHRLLGIDSQPAGIVFGIVLMVILGTAAARGRHVIASREWSARALFPAVIAVAIAAVVFVEGIFRSRYLLAVVGPLLAIVAMECVRWWDSGNVLMRATAALAIGACFLSFGSSAITMRSVFYVTANPRSPVILKPDERIVLDRVASLGCRVCYVYSGNAYDYRLLSQERVAFITWLGGHDQTPLDTQAARRLEGQRCYAGLDGSVIPIPGDLPLQGRGRAVPSRASLR